MFVSDTLTPISAKLLKKNGWHPIDDLRDGKGLPYAFVANYNGIVAKLVNNFFLGRDSHIILTDEWIFTLNDVDLTKPEEETDLIAKVSTMKYMEDLAFLLDLCHISWVKIRI